MTVTATTQLRMVELPHDRHDAAVRHLARIEELHRRVVRAGQVAVSAVHELELRAVRIHLIEIDAVDAAGVIPAAEQDLAVRSTIGS